MSEHQSEPGEDPGQTLKLPDSGYPPHPPQPPRPQPSPALPPAFPPTPPPAFATAFLPAPPPAGDPPPGGGSQPDPMPPRRPRRLNYWVAGAVGVVGAAALAAAAIVLAGSGRSDEPATTPSTSSAPATEPNVPATASAAASATASSGLSLAQARLADVLDPFELRGCRPSPVEGNFNVDAALVCHVDDVGDVRVLHYFDGDALQDEIKKRSGAIDDVGNCVDGQDSVETWGRGSRRMGTLMCFSNASGSHLFWTIDEQLVAFEVGGSDGVKLVSWWRRFDPLR